MDIKEFFNKYFGMIVGVILGLLVVAFGLIYFVECVFVVGLCGWLGYYIQNNKTTVKKSLKNGIDKILKDEDEE